MPMGRRWRWNAFILVALHEFRDRLLDVTISCAMIIQKVFGLNGIQKHFIDFNDKQIYIHIHIYMKKPRENPPLLLILVSGITNSVRPIKQLQPKPLWSSSLLIQILLPTLPTSKYRSFTMRCNPNRMSCLGPKVVSSRMDARPVVPNCHGVFGGPLVTDGNVD